MPRLVSTGSTHRIGDHLGSTSIVTDDAGNIINQTQYKAWGEVRYSSGTKQTSYGFTGQFSYAEDFGLLYYNARWYDSSLGRFAQADSIVPAGVQGLDRYAYVNNSPVKYTDPSGHMADEGDDGGCYPCGDGNGGGGGGGGDDNSDGDDEIVMGPPEPEDDLSSLRNVPSSVTLHPSNAILGDKNTFGGYVPVYSNGVLVGYRVARYSPDFSTTRIDLQAINLGKYLKMTIDNIVAGQLLKTAKLVGSQTMYSIAKKLSAASTAYDILSTANKLVIFDGNIEIVGPIMMNSQNTGSFPTPNIYFNIPAP